MLKEIETIARNYAAQNFNSSPAEPIDKERVKEELKRIEARYPDLFRRKDNGLREHVKSLYVDEYYMLHDYLCDSKLSPIQKIICKIKQSVFSGMDQGVRFFQEVKREFLSVFRSAQ